MFAMLGYAEHAAHLCYVRLLVISLAPVGFILELVLEYIM